MKILLADGKSKTLSALRLLIEQEAGLIVDAEAVDMAGMTAGVQSGKPDIVLLDWDLPGLKKQDLDDEHASEPIAALQTYCPGMKIIVLSSDPDDRRQALAAGADAFVSKGNPPDELLGILRELSNGCV